MDRRCDQANSQAQDYGHGQHESDGSMEASLNDVQKQKKPHVIEQPVVDARPIFDDFV